VCQKSIQLTTDNLQCLLFTHTHQAHFDCMQALLDAGADPSAVATNSKATPLENIVQLGRAKPGTVDAARCLLEHGAEANIGTPLATAATFGHHEMCALLLAAGAAVHAENAEGDTALACAAASGCVTTVQLLLSAGAMLLSPGGRATTMLYKAAVLSSPAVLQVLIDSAAWRALSTKQRDAALLQVLGRTSSLAIARVALAAGASVHSNGCMGYTALQFMAHTGRPIPLLCLLIQAGADVTTVGTCGETAAQLARAAGHLTAAALLERSEKDYNKRSS
jgi:uncharacterized protein